MHAGVRNRTHGTSHGAYALPAQHPGGHMRILGLRLHGEMGQQKHHFHRFQNTRCSGSINRDTALTVSSTPYPQPEL
jgi:hypothetical protein